MGIFLKKYTTFYYMTLDGSRIKICEIFCGKSLKKELSIDTTFDPGYFS